MYRLWEADFSRKKSYAPDGKSSKLLPQQSHDELIVSSVHSKLDRVLNFLQRELGYVLLDDAAPRRGGGVQLRHPPGPLASRAAGPRGHRSSRIPKGEPQVDEEETKQVIRFSTGTAKYAQYPDDLVLVWRFTNILANYNPESHDMVKQEGLYKTVLQGIRLMHLCSYDYSDLVLTLAYASVYFRRTCETIGHQMSNVEAAHVIVLLIFLAHCWVIDETCPLRYWQKYIFQNYCSVHVLDAALFRVLEMHDFRLRISEEDEKQALSVLLCSESGRDLMLRINEGADAQSRGQRPPLPTGRGTSAGSTSPAAGASSAAVQDSGGRGLKPAPPASGAGERRGSREGADGRDGCSRGTEGGGTESRATSTCTTASCSRDETPTEAPSDWAGGSGTSLEAGSSGR